MPSGDQNTQQQRLSNPKVMAMYHFARSYRDHRPWRECRTSRGQSARGVGVFFETASPEEVKQRLQGEILITQVDVALE